MHSRRDGLAMTLCSLASAERVQSTLCTTGGTMIDWRFIIVALIACVLVWAAVERWLLSAVRTKRLVRSQRCISADQAIVEHESGLARLFRNKSMLPGKWWLLRSKDQRDEYGLIANLQEFGFVVECRNSKERKLINSYSGKVDEVLWPFD